MRNIHNQNVAGLVHHIIVSYTRELVTSFGDTGTLVWHLFSLGLLKPSLLHLIKSQADFPADNNNRASFKFKTKITDKIGNNSTRDVKIMVPLKYCEINRILTWSATCFIIHASINNEVPTFTITVTNFMIQL